MLDFHYATTRAPRLATQRTTHALTQVLFDADGRDRGPDARGAAHSREVKHAAKDVTEVANGTAIGVDLVDGRVWAPNAANFCKLLAHGVSEALRHV